jgi:uncharacterized protein YlaI
MNVTYDGRVNQIREIWCQECESTFEATISELGPVHQDARDGAYYNVECPVCHKKLFLDANAINSNTQYNPNRRVR